MAAASSGICSPGCWPPSPSGHLGKEQTHAQNADFNRPRDSHRGFRITRPCHRLRACNSGSRAPVVILGEPRDEAHAHNDYEHDRPLYDALEHGFTSVEAEVWLVDGELLVAHDCEDVQPGVTLESLYLDPLTDLVKGNGRSVYLGWNGEFQLLSTSRARARQPTRPSRRNWPSTAPS